MAQDLQQKQGQDDAVFDAFGEIDSESVSNYLVSQAEMLGQEQAGDPVMEAWDKVKDKMCSMVDRPDYRPSHPAKWDKDTVFAPHGIGDAIRDRVFESYRAARDLVSCDAYFQREKIHAEELAARPSQICDGHQGIIRDVWKTCYDMPDEVADAIFAACERCNAFHLEPTFPDEEKAKLCASKDVFTWCMGAESGTEPFGKSEFVEDVMPRYLGIRRQAFAVELQPESGVQIGPIVTGSVLVPDEAPRQYDIPQMLSPDTRLMITSMFAPAYDGKNDGMTTDYDLACGLCTKFEYPADKTVFGTVGQLQGVSQDSLSAFERKLYLEDCIQLSDCRHVGTPIVLDSADKISSLADMQRLTGCKGWDYYQEAARVRAGEQAAAKAGTVPLCRVVGEVPGGAKEYSIRTVEGLKFSLAGLQAPGKSWLKEAIADRRVQFDAKDLDARYEVISAAIGLDGKKAPSYAAWMRHLGVDDKKAAVLGKAHEQYVRTHEGQRYAVGQTGRRELPDTSSIERNAELQAGQQYE